MNTAERQNTFGNKITFTYGIASLYFYSKTTEIIALWLRIGTDIMTDVQDTTASFLQTFSSYLKVLYKISKNNDTRMN